MTQGDRLRKARKSKGLSQDGLANLSGVGRVTITQIESGKVSSIDGANLLKLAEVLEINPKWLIDGSEPQGMLPMLPASHYEHMDVAAAIPEFSNVTDSVMEIIRTLSLVNASIDDETRGEIKSLLVKLEAMHASIAQQVAEPSGAYVVAAESEQALLTHFRSLGASDKEMALSIIAEIAKKR